MCWNKFLVLSSILQQLESDERQSHWKLCRYIAFRSRNFDWKARTCAPWTFMHVCTKWDARTTIQGCSKNDLRNLLRATFCNHRESPDSFNFFEFLIISPKIPFDELFLKNILKTSSDINFFENFRKSDRAPEVPIFECKLCTKAQHHRILQKRPIGFRLLTEPSLSFFYMWDVIKYPYLNKLPFLTACKTTTWKCRDRLSKIAHFQAE